MATPGLPRIPGGGRETRQYASPCLPAQLRRSRPTPAPTTQQLPQPARLPATRVVLPELPATVDQLSDMATDALREPAVCWTLSSSREHIAALCELVTERLEPALRAADAYGATVAAQLAAATKRICDVSSQLETARTTAIATEHARRHETLRRIDAEESLLIARDAHQVTALELEAAELRAEADGIEIARLERRVAELERQNEQLEQRLLKAAFTRATATLTIERFEVDGRGPLGFDMSDLDAVVIDVDGGP